MAANGGVEDRHVTAPDRAASVARMAAGEAIAA